MADKARDDAKRTNVSDETILEHYEIREEFLKKISTLNGQMRNALKRAKADGVTLSVLKRVADDKRRDAEEVASEHHDYLRYSSILNQPAWAMFDEVEQDISEPSEVVLARVAKNDATQAGVDAGRAGADRVTGNPFEAGTMAYHAWETGWHQGDETRKVLKSEGNPPRAAGKRGRPAGAKAGKTAKGPVVAAAPPAEPTAAEPAAEAEAAPPGTPLN